MKIHALLFLLSLFCCSVTLLAKPSQPETLAEYKAIYEREAKKIQDLSPKVLKAEQQYLETLKVLEVDFKKAGDFPSTKAVIEETERFESCRMIPDTMPEGTIKAIADAQKLYRDVYAVAERAKSDSLIKLTRLYMTALKGHTRTLLEQDKMVEAEAVNDEIKKGEGLIQELGKKSGTETLVSGSEKANPKKVEPAEKKTLRATMKSPMIGDWVGYTQNGTRVNAPVHSIRADGRIELKGLPTASGTYKFTNTDKTSMKRTCKDGQVYVLNYDKETDTILQSEGSVFRREKQDK